MSQIQHFVQFHCRPMLMRTDLLVNYIWLTIQRAVIGQHMQRIMLKQCLFIFVSRVFFVWFINCGWYVKAEDAQREVFQEGLQFKSMRMNGILGSSGNGWIALGWARMVQCPKIVRFQHPHDSWCCYVNISSIQKKPYAHTNAIISQFYLKLNDHFLNNLRT